MSTAPSKETPTEPTCARELRAAVEDGARRLCAFSDEQAALRPPPGKWSKKEIVGHLIDSATNNHGRFVRAIFTPDLVFPGYEQDDWVGAQNYRARPWLELIETWRLLNLQIAHVMATIPDHERTRLRARHNLHQIAWRPVCADQPVTLAYFLADYVGHLRHHLEQAAR